MVGVETERKLCSDLTDIIDRKRAALAYGVLDAAAHLHDARSLVSRRDKTAKICHAVGERVHIGTTGDSRLCRSEIRLQVFDRLRDRAQGAAADLGRDI